MSETAGRRWGWAIAILIVSVGLNCLLVGYVLGRHLVPFDDAARRPAASAQQARSNFNLGERLKALPADERQKFQEAMKPFRPDIRRSREDLQDARAHLSEAVTADPYDPEKMRQAFADVRAKTAILQEKAQDAAAQALSALSLESRKQLGAP